jgi:Ca-activated chloride channel family protein
MPPRVSLTAAFVSLLLSPSTTAQEKPTFSARSELVVLHVTVEDRKGTYISGLQQDQFTVLEDGKPQHVQFFSAADTPATIGLIIDNSTSMMNKREMVVAAAVGFTKVSNPEDEIFVLAFNENVTQIWEPRLIAATNPVSMRAVLQGGISARGRTALHDAIARGLDGLSSGKHTRQVLVVISDGSDNASTRTLDEVLARMRSSEAAIFTVMLKDPVLRDGNPKLLKRLATETGGESFEPDKVDDIPETLEHIARDIRSAYTIGFVPASSEGDRALRKLRVDVRAHGRTLKARTRGGYVVRGQS